MRLFCGDCEIPLHEVFVSQDGSSVLILSQINSVDLKKTVRDFKMKFEDGSIEDLYIFDAYERSCLVPAYDVWFFTLEAKNTAHFDDYIQQQKLNNQIRRGTLR